jgi:tetratricopeptide (TPR) repeat protein
LLELGRGASFRYLLSALGLITAIGCHSRDPESPSEGVDTKSLAEYDVARDLWLRQNQPRQALEHALAAVDMDSANAEASHLVALLYLDFCRRSAGECRLPEAERYARKALDAYPKFREARNTLGVVLIHEKKYDAAIATLKPLSEDILYLTPETAWGNLGWAYLDSDRIDQAIEALKRAVAAQPAFCVGYFRLGRAYEKKKDSEAALHAYTRALEADERCAGMQDALAARGRLRFTLGRTDEARSDLDQCERLDKRSASGKECSALLKKLE